MYLVNFPLKNPLKAYSLYDIFIVVDNFSNNKIPAQMAKIYSTVILLYFLSVAFLSEGL